MLTPVADPSPDRQARAAVDDLAGRAAHWLPELTSVGTMVLVGLGSWAIMASEGQQQTLATPTLIALLMVANLVPAMMLIMLIGRRIARARSNATLDGGNGALHQRLVALFSLLAAVPTLVVAIFASLMFQFGFDFWFSQRSRGMIENALDLAQGYYQENGRQVSANTVAMAKDLRVYLRAAPIESREFLDYYLQQVVVRNLNESAVIEVGTDGVARTAAMIDPDNRVAEQRVTPAMVRALLDGAPFVVRRNGNRIESATLLAPGTRVFLYAARDSGVLGSSQLRRARAVVDDYNSLFRRSQALQLRFNVALYLGALLILALAVAAAMIVADRLVRPLGVLVAAARTAADGDLSVRVPEMERSDEVAVLSAAFNVMAGRLEAQTQDLRQVNAQLDARRAFIETVLTGVSAGVISVDANYRVSLVNSSAERLLRGDGPTLPGQSLEEIAPELASLIRDGRGEAIIQVGDPRDPRTVAAKHVGLADGHVVTFEDITQRQIDQRRAAWSDVARRVAHEIRNPLTPIQLAAERLQRRYGSVVENDPAVFAKLTATIVRQVGDLRRMVDEFSSFARMPRAAFAAEDILDILRKAIFLQEVSNPDIEFDLQSDMQSVELVCDQRLLSQAFTNILKNGVEAIHAARAQNDAVVDQPDCQALDGHRIITTVSQDAVGHVALIVISFQDSGIGLPRAREKIVEPYMTTRPGGTGLGLAIVSKIIEEHRGEMSFRDGPLGGAEVRLTFDPKALSTLMQRGQAPLSDEGIPIHLIR